MCECVAASCQTIGYSSGDDLNCWRDVCSVSNTAAHISSDTHRLYLGNAARVWSELVAVAGSTWFLADSRSVFETLSQNLIFPTQTRRGRLLLVDKFWRDIVLHCRQGRYSNWQNFHPPSVCWVFTRWMWEMYLWNMWSVLLGMLATLLVSKRFLWKDSQTIKLRVWKLKWKIVMGIEWGSSITSKELVIIM